MSSVILSPEPESHCSAQAIDPQPTAVAAKNLCKAYRRGTTQVPVLQGASLEVSRGDFCAIVGASGSGKSTLLHLLATLDQPDAGEVFYAGKRIDNLSRSRRDRIRNTRFGMVFQFYYLLPELTALENVLLPAMIGRGVMSYFNTSGHLKQKAAHLLETVGLAHRIGHRPKELSGGEIQRAAIARALMSDPEVLFADEPTGNLDRKTGEEVMALLMSLNAEKRLTIIMVTHDQLVVRKASMSLTLCDGQLQSFGACNHEPTNLH